MRFNTYEMSCFQSLRMLEGEEGFVLRVFGGVGGAETRTRGIVTDEEQRQLETVAELPGIV